jgi:pantoate--beta-alanine ligase
MHDTLATEPQADIEYISLADRDTLRELDTIPTRGALASLAVRIGKTRLIDNCILEK